MPHHHRGGAGLGGQRATVLQKVFGAAIQTLGDTLDGIDRRQFEAALRNVETLRVAKARAAASIAITRSPLSPLGRMANVVLSTASRETRFRAEALASRIAQTAILRRKTGLFLDMTPQKI